MVNACEPDGHVMNACACIGNEWSHSRMEADDEQKESFDISFEKGNFAKPINQVCAIIIYVVILPKKL